MNIGDMVRYVLTKDLVLGIIVGMHDTDSLFHGSMTLYHVEWFNDGHAGWAKTHALTHESHDRLEVVQ
tara:strand:- start:114 stop:317 length:204 start_codon:yes stop_codon:yes gene_type:complete